MPSIVTGPAASGGAGASAAPRRALFGPHAGRALVATGLIYLVGTAVDLGILWFLQRQPGIQWEFVAITRTAEAWPRFILAVALVYGGVHLWGVVSPLVYKGLAAIWMALGLSAIGLVVLMMLNYLSIEGAGENAGGELIRSAVFKTVILCALYIVLLVPTGWMGFKTPKT